MNRNKYLLKNTLFYSLANIGPKIINFIMVPLYTHVFTVDQYGTIDIIYILSLLLTPLIMLNVHEAILRFSMDDNTDHSKLISSSLCVSVIGASIALIVIPVLNKISILREYSIYIYIYYIVSSFKPMFTTFLRGTERLMLFSVISIIETFLNALLNILFLVVFNFGIKGYLLSLILSQIVSILIALIGGHLYKYIRVRSICFKAVNEMIRYSSILIPNSILWWLISSMDRFSISYYLGVAANGIYAIAFKLPTIVSILVGIFVQAWQLSAIKNLNAEDSDEYSYKIYVSFYKMVFIIGGLLLVILKPFMKIYVANEFYVAWRYAPLLVFAFMFGALGNFLASYYVAHKSNIGNMMSALFGCCINLVLNITLIPKIGIIGASVATLLSYFVIYIYRCINIRKLVGFKTLDKNLIINIILFTIQIITLYLQGYRGIIINLISTLILFIYNKEVIVRMIQTTLFRSKDKS